MEAGIHIAAVSSQNYFSSTNTHLMSQIFENSMAVVAQDPEEVRLVTKLHRRCLQFNNSVYFNSAEFSEFLYKLKRKIKNDPRNTFVYLKELVDELKSYQSYSRQNTLKPSFLSNSDSSDSMSNCSNPLNLCFRDNNNKSCAFSLLSRTNFQSISNSCKMTNGDHCAQSTQIITISDDSNSGDDVSNTCIVPRSSFQNILSQNDPSSSIFQNSLSQNDPSSSSCQSIVPWSDPSSSFCQKKLSLNDQSSSSFQNNLSRNELPGPMSIENRFKSAISILAPKKFQDNDLSKFENQSKPPSFFSQNNFSLNLLDPVILPRDCKPFNFPVILLEDVRKSPLKTHLKVNLEQPSTSRGLDASVEASEVKNDTCVERKKVSRRHIRKLEKILRKLDKAIKKLAENDLSMEDLDDDNSFYLQEDRLKRHYVKVFKKLCEFKKREPLTGRLMESKLSFKGSRIPEVNKVLTKFLRKTKIFPDFHDINTLIEKANVKYGLKISPRNIEQLAQEAFLDIGKVLKRRRLEDFEMDFGCHLTDNLLDNDDPALVSSDLQIKLEENAKLGDMKMEKLINDYVQQQYTIGEVAQEVSLEEVENIYKNVDYDEEKEGEKLNNLNDTPHVSDVLQEIVDDAEEIEDDDDESKKADSKSSDEDDDDDDPELDNNVPEDNSDEDIDIENAEESIDESSGEIVKLLVGKEDDPELDNIGPEDNSNSEVDIELIKKNDDEPSGEMVKAPEADDPELDNIGPDDNSNGEIELIKKNDDEPSGEMVKASEAGNPVLDNNCVPENYTNGMIRIETIEDVKNKDQLIDEPVQKSAFTTQEYKVMEIVYYDSTKKETLFDDFENDRTATKRFSYNLDSEIQVANKQPKMESHQNIMENDVTSTNEIEEVTPVRLNSPDLIILDSD